MMAVITIAVRHDSHTTGRTGTTRSNAMPMISASASGAAGRRTNSAVSPRVIGVKSGM